MRNNPVLVAWLKDHFNQERKCFEGLEGVCDAIHRDIERKGDETAKLVAESLEIMTKRMDEDRQRAELYRRRIDLLLNRVEVLEQTLARKRKRLPREDNDDVVDDH
jgi:hypothetical protein